MNRITVLWILEAEDLEILPYGPMPDKNGHFGFYIGSYDETPSGCKRPRPIVSSDAIYDTGEVAVQAAKDLVKQVREQASREDQRAKALKRYYCAQCHGPASYIQDSDAITCVACETGRWLAKKLDPKDITENPDG